MVGVGGTTEFGVGVVEKGTTSQRERGRGDSWPCMVYAPCLLAGRPCPKDDGEFVVCRRGQQAVVQLQQDGIPGTQY